MKAIALALGTATALCACTTFAPVGRVDYRTTDDLGQPRTEVIVGLFAVPTPSGNTLVLLPLYKSYRFREQGGGLPESVSRWLSESSAPSAPITDEPPRP